MNGERGFADSAERCSLIAGQIEFADFAEEEGAHQVTTPDIEKLRGLLETMPHNGATMFGSNKNQLGHEQSCYVCRLKAAGLSELLRDYERLLAKENGDKS